MGLIHSIFCTITFCMERVLTWMCCAFVLIMLLTVIMGLMVYGVTVGYSYAQKELAAFASHANSLYKRQLSMMPGAPSTPMRRRRRSGDGGGPPGDQTFDARPTQPVRNAYRNRKAKKREVLKQKPTSAVVLQTERPPAEPEMQPYEKELARQLIGRLRRSKQNNVTTNNNGTTTKEPLLTSLSEISSTPAIAA